MSLVGFFGPCLALLAALGPGLGEQPGRAEKDAASEQNQRIKEHLKKMDVPFDRFRLLAARRSGENSVIALTTSGHLARFQSPAFGLIKARKEVAKPVVCLGKGEKETILAGLADGRVCRVDPETLGLTEVAKLPGFVDWVETPEGRDDSGLLAAVQPFHKTGRRELIDLDNHVARPLEHGPTVFFLDHRRNLWLGSDFGEWGGFCERYELDACRFVSVTEYANRAKWSGFLGFIEPVEGQVWAYGGTAHMFGSNCFIARVDHGKPETLVAFDNSARSRISFLGEKPAAEPIRPRRPISQILKDPDGKGYYVFSYNDLFFTNRRFSRWERVGELDLLYKFGRPDAVGSYPAVLGVFRFGEEMVLATRADGLVRLNSRAGHWSVVDDPIRPRPVEKAVRSHGAFE